MPSKETSVGTYLSDSLGFEVKITRALIGAARSGEGFSFEAFTLEFYKHNHLGPAAAKKLWEELTPKSGAELTAISKHIVAKKKSFAEIMEEKAVVRSSKGISGLTGADLGDSLYEDNPYGGTDFLDALLREGEKEEGVKVSPKSTGKKAR